MDTYHRGARPLWHETTHIQIRINAEASGLATPYLYLEDNYSLCSTDIYEKSNYVLKR